MQTADRRVAILIAYIPTALVVGQTALFYAYVLRARLALGRWPRSMADSVPGFDVHGHVVAYGGLLVAASPLLAIGLLLKARALALSTRHLRVAVASYVGSYLAVVALFVADPGGFGTWFLD